MMAPAGMVWRSLLRGMARNVFPRANTELVCVVKPLYVFFDESGIQEGSQSCVVAGYMGSVRQCLLFDEGWRRELGKFDLPEFHAKRFFSRHARPFCDWPPTQRLELLQGLLNVINLHRVTPIGAVIDVLEFQRRTLAERRFFTGGLIARGRKRWLTTGAPSRPYFLAFQSCIAQALHCAKTGKVVHFVFDQQDTFAPLALQVFNEARVLLTADDSKKMGGCVFLSRKEAPPLQAADLLAHCWYAYGKSGESLSREREYALIKMKGHVHGLRLYDSRAFEIMLNTMHPEDRAALGEAKLNK